MNGYILISFKIKLLYYQNYINLFFELNNFFGDWGFDYEDDE